MIKNKTAKNSKLPTNDFIVNLTRTPLPRQHPDCNSDA